MSLSPEDQALKQAIRDGDLAAAKTLIENGANPLYEDGDAIFIAADYGYLDILTYYVWDLVNEGHSAIMDYLGNALIIAAASGQQGIVEYLINGGHVAISIPAVKYALLYATQNGHLSIVDFLRSKGADITFSNGTLLIEAVNNGHDDVVAYLLSYIDINIQGGLAIFQAAVTGNLSTLELLVSNGANLSLMGDASLAEAAYGGHLAVVEYLISQGVDPNANEGYSLTRAAEGGDLDMVIYLVGLGVTSATAIQAATNAGRQDVVNYLTDGTLPSDDTLADDIIDAVEKGNLPLLVTLITESNYQEDAKEFALLYAAIYGNLSIVRHLVEVMGTSPILDGNYPIMVAAYYGHLDVVKYLVSRGASRSIALPYAIDAGHQDVVDYLSEKNYHRKSRVMSSFCRTKPSCPTPPTGYNVCIENDTDINQVYLFGPLPDNGNLADVVTTQSVTVPRNTSICYRILSPLGEPVVVITADPVVEGETAVWGIISCSVHITTRAVVSADAGSLAVALFTTLDCSPCPCPCEFTCASEKKACESVTGIGLGLGFGITKKLAELCSEAPPTHCPYGTSSDVAGSESWMFT